MKIKSKSKLIIALICSAVLILSAITVLFSIDKARYYLIERLCEIFYHQPYYTEYYVNNIKQDEISDEIIEKNDVKTIQINRSNKTMTNHSRGYSVSFPRDAVFDFSAAQEYIKVQCDNMSAVISKEFSTYESKDDTKKFVDDYLNKYLLDERYMEQNKITLHKNAVERIGDFWVQIVALSRTPLPDSTIEYNSYVYCYIYLDSTMFYRIMFKAPEYNDELMEDIYRTLYSFNIGVKVEGTSATFTDFKPEIPEFWSDETKEFYDNLKNSTSARWGLYQPLCVVKNDFTDIYKVEEELDSKFDALLEYRYFFEDLPVDGIKRAYDEGRIIQLTLQTSTVMNEELDGYNPVFDIIDGMYDWRFKIMARQIKEIGHPILFRLNNEMNSDWTSYGSSACLDDPEIYITLWRRIYNIFKAEGVDNAIWIFNPNDESFPPCGYNASIAFYPGNEYVQLFGVTGYNTGSYYAAENGEKWRSFREIYDNIMQKHHHIYDNFPWIITEFASSSVGGDKVQWINEMFDGLDDYQNIKMAFWFNSADLDTREEMQGAVARPYWLDETPETTKAFSDGLKKIK